MPDLYPGLTLQRLQVFVAVADHGGFSAAADYLDLGQPTVSFHIKALEKLFGAELVVYRERRVYLTAEGQALYAAATDILQQAERVAATIRSVGEGQAGQLRVGASIAFELPAFFQRVVAPFQQKHPRLQLSFEFGHSVRLAEAVHDRNLDLAYVVYWRLPADARYTPLHAADFVLMVAPQHPLASRQRVSSDDTYEAGLITAPMFSREWPHYEHLLRNSGLARYRIGLEIDGVQARLTATQAGLGVMGVFVPPYAVENLRPLLHPLSLESPPPKAEFGLVMPPRHVQTAASRQFADWLRLVSSTEASVCPEPTIRQQPRIASRQPRTRD